MMIIRLGLNLLPRARLRDSTTPQLSSFLGSFYSGESDDIQYVETSVDNAKPP